MLDDAAEEQSGLLSGIERALGHQAFADEDITGLAEVAQVWAQARFHVVTSRFDDAGVTRVSVTTPGGRTLDITPYLHAVVRRTGTATEVRLLVPRFPSELGFATVATTTDRGRTFDRRIAQLGPDHPRCSTAADLRAAETVLKGIVGAALIGGHAGNGGRARSEPWKRGPLSKTERQARWRASHRTVTVELPMEVAQALRSTQAAVGGGLADVVMVALNELTRAGRS